MKEMNQAQVEQNPCVHNVLSVNTRIFGNFLHEDGVIVINNPNELYAAFDLFRHTYYNFFNMVDMSDTRLLTTTIKRCSDRLSNVKNFRGVQIEDQHLLNLCVYYYLKDLYNFKGFPVFLHVRKEWDESLYELDDRITQSTGIPEKLMKQIEFLYLSGNQLMEVNEREPYQLVKSITVNHSVWKLEDQKPTEDGGYNPPLLKNSIDEKIYYPVAFITPGAMDGMVVLKKLMNCYTDTQKSAFIQGTNLEAYMYSSLDKDDRSRNCSDQDIQKHISEFHAFLRGSVPMRVYGDDDLKLVDTLLAFFSYGTCEKLEFIKKLEDDFDGRTDGGTRPYFIVVPPMSSVIECFEETPETYVDISTMKGFLKDMEERLIFLLNVEQPLLYAMPVSNIYIPPRFIWTLFDQMATEIRSGEDEKHD